MTATLESPPTATSSAETQRLAKLDAQLQKAAEEKRELDARLEARNSQWAALCLAAHHALASVRQAKGTAEGVRADAETHRGYVRGTIRRDPGEAIRIAGEVARLENSVPVLESMIEEIEAEAAAAVDAARKFAQAEGIAQSLWPSELK